MSRASEAAIAAAGEASASSAWRALVADGRAHTQRPSPPEPPRSLLRFLGRAREGEPAEGSVLGYHYEIWLPAARVEQLGAALYAPLLHRPWTPNPDGRYAHGIARLRRWLQRANIDLARAPGLDVAADSSVAERFAPCMYGQFAPMLGASPFDLNAILEDLEGPSNSDVPTLIEDRLAGPLLHELAHFGRHREALPPVLDEAVAAWVGVRIDPAMAWPAPGAENGFLGAPWSFQLGELLAWAVGEDALLRAQAGVASWTETLGAPLLDALQRHAWGCFEADRSVHLLDGVMAPESWRDMIESAVVSDALGPAASPQADAHNPPEVHRPSVLERLRHGLQSMTLSHRVDRGRQLLGRAIPRTPVLLDGPAGVMRTQDPGLCGMPPQRYLLPPTVRARLNASPTPVVPVTVACFEDCDALGRRIASDTLDRAPPTDRSDPTRPDLG